MEANDKWYLVYVSDNNSSDEVLLKTEDNDEALKINDEWFLNIDNWNTQDRNCHVYEFDNIRSMNEFINTKQLNKI